MSSDDGIIDEAVNGSFDEEEVYSEEENGYGQNGFIEEEDDDDDGDRFQFTKKNGSKRFEDGDFDEEEDNGKV